MRHDTRIAFNKFTAAIARLNGTDDRAVASKFSVTPSVQQTMETKIQESSAFLQSINVMGVDEQAGQALGLGVSGSIASTTDTDQADRTTADPTSLTAMDYLCEQINYDTHIKYSKLDAWAAFPDFARRINDVILQRIALDRIMCGFNGTSRAATSNRVTNPLLQDVKKGWLQRIRDAGATHHVSSVTIGAAEEFKNLDAVVYDAVNSLIDPWYRDDTGLVAIIGRELLADKYIPLVNAVHAPTEQKAAQDLVMSQKRVGNLPAVQVPYFPANAVLVTRLDNLSIYYQRGAQRRSVIDNPKRDRIETYQSSNDDYVIEDLGCSALIEGITIAP